jgi:hypothetical protein
VLLAPSAWSLWACSHQSMCAMLLRLPWPPTRCLRPCVASSGTIVSAMSR